MQISVIIPTYTPGAYLWECLASVNKQTFPKTQYEVIIVLNGCDEPYRSLINDFIHKYADVNYKFIQTNTPGVSNARNIGMDNASGEFITFIDDDDYVSPNYLQELYNNATNRIVSICYPYAFDDGQPEVQRRYAMSNVYDKRHGNGVQRYTAARKFFSGPCMKLIHKDIIAGDRFDVRLKNGEDSVFMFQISNRLDKICFTDRSAIYYRRYRPCSATTSKKQFSYYLNNCIQKVASYLDIYIKGEQYDFFFFITRVLGAFKTLMLDMLKMLKTK